MGSNVLRYILSSGMGLLVCF